MSSPALTKTRIVVGTVMAAATIATTGMAASLALARTEQQADAGTADPTQTASQPAKHRSTNTTQTSTTQNFAPTRPAPNTSGTTHTKTKGS
jgi:hypothetical protein